MKNLHTKMTGLFILSLLVTPALVSAGDDYKKKENPSVVYNDYYGQFKKEFYEQLLKGDFTQIDKRIAWYEGDVQYLSEHPESEHYKNISVYKEKIRVLQQLKANFASQEVKKELPKQEMYNKQKVYEEKQAELKKINQEKQEQIKKIVAEKQEDTKKHMEWKKQEMKEVKDTYRDQKQELIKKYKQQFQKTLSQRIANLSEEQTIKVMTNVEKAIQKYENLSLSEERRQRFLAQLEALKQLLQARLDESQDVIDIESLFVE